MASRSKKKQKNKDSRNSVQLEIKEKEVTRKDKVNKWFEESGKGLVGLIVICAFLLISITGLIRNCGGPSQGQYGEIISSNPSLIDIGSTDCIPCRELQPILVNLGEKYDGEINIKFYDSWNTAEGKKMGNKYNVTTIPTLLFVDADGVELSRMTGFNDQNTIEDRFLQHGWV